MDKVIWAFVLDNIICNMKLHYYYFILQQLLQDYNARLAHVELAAKMRKRDAGSAPRLGVLCN
jgi:DNA polymerase delta subunit 1